MIHHSFKKVLRERLLNTDSFWLYESMNIYLLYESMNIYLLVILGKNINSIQN